MTPTTDTHPRPSQAQLAWHYSETNAFFHFGLNTFTGREWGDGTEDPAMFNPSELDCRQWARVAKAGGFKVGILTAKHHDGFCLWPTTVTEHSVKNAPWRDGKGDLVREFVDAFRAEGLEVGLYLSPWDRHEPCYGDSPRYNDFYCAQLEELLSNYGELREVWFDGACAEGRNGRKQDYDWPRYFEIVKRLQPNAVTFGDGGTDVRWVGNERGIAGETCWATVADGFIRFPGDSGISQANDARADVDKLQRLEEGDAPDGAGPYAWRPAECDVSIRPGWFYHEEEDREVRSVENLMDLYFKSVGRNGVLLLNLPITPEGIVHEVDAARVRAFREERSCLFEKNLAGNASVEATSEAEGCSALSLLDSNPESTWRPQESDPIPSICLNFSEPVEASVLCLQEAIAQGQNIASYQVEVQDRRGTWKALIDGTTIGHKRLHRFEATELCAMRFKILKSYNLPAIASIELYANHTSA